MIERYIFFPKILFSLLLEYFIGMLISLRIVNKKKKKTQKETHPIFDRFLAVRYHRKSIRAFHAIVVVDKTVLQREIYIFDSFF